MLSQLVKSTTRYYTVQTVLCITPKVVPHLGTACRQFCILFLQLTRQKVLLRFQAPRSGKAAPVAVLVPEYEGPILNPVASSQHTVLNGVMFVDYVATTGSQATVGASIADITPSEAGAACDMSSSDHLDTALAALDNPIVAQAPCLRFSTSVDVPPLALCQSGFCFFDASDSLDYKASWAEALARLCKRASEDGQAQSASQTVTDCQQQKVQEAGASPLSLSAAAAASGADAAADNPQSPAGPEENLNTACGLSADDAYETFSDNHLAIVDALMTSEVQHAAVDQMVDDLLDEASAPLQPMQSSLPADTISDDLSAKTKALVSSEAQHAAVDQVVDNLLAEVAAPFQPALSSVPADTTGMASPIVSLPANCVAAQHAAVDQVVDELLAQVSAPLQPLQSSMPADISGRVSPKVSPRVSLPPNCFAPQQAVSLPAVTTPDGCCVSSTTHSHPLPPIATAAKHSSAELLPVGFPSSSSSGKENCPVAEAGHVSMSGAVKQDRAVADTMGRGRGRVCCLDRSTFQEMAQALPTEPSSQVMQPIMVSLHFLGSPV